MAATQANRSIAVDTPLGEDALLLHAVSFTESLGRMFQIDLDLLSEDGKIDADKLIGQNVTIRIDQPNQRGAGKRYLNGYVTRFGRSLAAGGYASYSCTVRPWLWFLTLTSDCRIFQDQTVPEIIKDVFRKAGFADFQERLTGSYRRWDYCVQYRETDFNFVSRLMEQEGIYYYFSHENGKHELVLADSPGSHDEYPGYDEIPYRPASSGFSDGEEINHWSVGYEVQPGGYALNDFDFEKPKKKLVLKSSIAREHANAQFELYDSPGDYAKFADGQAYAKVRMEELSTRFEVSTGSSDARGIAAGCKFKLTDAPVAALSKKYLVTSSSLHASVDNYQGGGGEVGSTTFSCSFTATDASVQYRPARITPKPVVQGPQTAVIAGKPGEEIWTDQFGRVKLQFHWDRYGQADEKSSCWVRVAQVSAGNQWGGMSLPRIGQEVIVEFLEGDPDRPIVTGRVYNGDAMPPYELPNEATKSTLKTNSSKGGGGFNELRFEDKKGKEQVFVHGEKDLDIRAKHDGKEYIGRDQHSIVKRNKLDRVDGNHHQGVGGDQLIKVTGNQGTTINADRMVTITSDDNLSVTGNIKQQATGDISQQSSQNFYEKSGMNYGLEAGMNAHIKGGMNVVIEAGMSITLKAGGGFVVVGPAGVAISGTPVLINSGGAAGSGSGCSPVAPDAPDPVKYPLEADDGQPGKSDDAAQTDPPPEPTQFSPSAQKMVDAAARGDPFCEADSSSTGEGE